jgi:hypothetical protein
MADLTCLCDDALESVTNDRCSAIDYGTQIVKVFFQKMTGADFDGTSGNTVTIEADWQTRIVSDTEDRIAVFGNLAGAQLPATDPNVEEDNAVPYGGIEIIDWPREFSGELKYLNAAGIAQLDQVNCWPQVRMWFLTNKNWLFAADATLGTGIPNSSVIPMGYRIEGIGTKNRAGIRVKWNNLCNPRPVAQLNFLATIEGSNVSGSTV